ncbi:SatD family (SatD) [Clostridium cavendishii DSM 21758]|uniref:SatD family (SatD) n=1 Tax=Clostridium cavendishii DSM 21758 TaxID=1121302 RepID=A0A1M6I383_9CLOT|nr:SatD family protein [Clostridium cavendishii]SHJ28868.1 SatD family (SatD) [Clostridium cavendishii DSM 21758]
MNYITMIFDIKHSRNLLNRNEIQENLIKVIKKCNQLFSDIILSPFLITLGDEWQGLLKGDSDYNEVIKFFKNNLPSDINFYTGVGIGSITINNFELTVNQLDGPSFHLARKAIKYAKRNNCDLVIFINEL